MHDEAAPTYVDMLDNTHVGQRNIVSNFGVGALPLLTWQIDPFGHSAFQGVMSGPLSGYVGVMWGREAAEFRASSQSNRMIERVWMPSPSLGSNAACFQGIFAGGGYGPPASVGRCNGSRDPKTCNAALAAGDVELLKLDLLFDRSIAVRGPDVLLMFGTDFTGENMDDAGGPNTGYFSYLDALINLLNADPQHRFNAFYSSGAQYAAAKLASVKSLPLLRGDLFPYNDDAAGHNMWSGYFTSRPAFKAFVRESSAYMQSARQLQALVGGVTDLGPKNPLFALERAMGVTQHHDGVSGTAKQNVDFDYSLILEGGRVGAFASLASSFAAVTGFSTAPFSVCALSNVTLCPSLEAGAPTVVLVYNALAQVAPAAPVRLSVGLPSGVASYAVYDHTGAPVTAQLVPLSARDASLRALYNGSATPTQWLCFQGALPAAGFSAFFLIPKAAREQAPHTHESALKHLAGSEADVTIKNSRLTLTISAATGFMSAFADVMTGVSIPLSQSWGSYTGFDGKSNMDGSTQASGAYIFRPKGVAAALSPEPGTVVLVTGPVVNEAQTTYAYVSQATRLWAASGSVEVEWTVGPVDVSDGQSHEVITRYTSAGLATNATWRTDSNCREAQVRIRNERLNWTAALSEPISGNYVPVNCLAVTSSPAVTLAAAVDRSQGSTSLVDGELEFMVHRRMLFDDKRGVGEALNEPGVDGNGLVIRGRHWLVASPTATAPAVYKALQQQALALPSTVVSFAPLGALSPSAWLAAYKGSASSLTAPLPPNVHLVTLHAQGPTQLLLRLAHIYDVGEDAVLSAPASVDLATLLTGRTITAAVEMTLPGTQPLAGVKPTTFTTDGGAVMTVPVLPPPPSGAELTITLSVQQIRTFIVTTSA